MILFATLVDLPSKILDSAPLGPVDKVKMFALFKRFHYPFFADVQVGYWKVIID